MSEIKTGTDDNHTAILHISQNQTSYEDDLYSYHFTEQ